MGIIGDGDIEVVMVAAVLGVAVVIMSNLSTTTTTTTSTTTTTTITTSFFAIQHYSIPLNIALLVMVLIDAFVRLRWRWW